MSTAASRGPGWPRGPTLVAFALLSVYSAVLMVLEIRVSQAFARSFFADIEGPVPFYAVNTSLSVFLQLATALVFAACLVCIEGDKGRKRERSFYRSQILLFTFLACDDRFLFHEKLGARLGIEDAFILLAIGVMEVVFLLTWGDLLGRSPRERRHVLTAAALFGLMVSIDAFLPRELVPRLSLEDLSKTWAVLFLFLFAWEVYRGHIAALRSQAGQSPSSTPERTEPLQHLQQAKARVGASRP